MQAGAGHRSKGKRLMSWVQPPQLHVRVVIRQLAGVELMCDSVRSAFRPRAGLQLQKMCEGIIICKFAGVELTCDSVLHACDGIIFGEFLGIKLRCDKFVLLSQSIAGDPLEVHKQ